ncbi:MAG TPA: hypothetical protein VJT82_00255 [Pyrinomonadaceae bacterium]|nr:hypothetical protein [Pyrinomonadaceae bacterium]
MKKQRSRFVGVTAYRLSAVISLFLLAAGAAFAQGAPGGVGAPGRVNPKGDNDLQTGREASLRSAEMGAASGQVNQQRLAAAIEQTKNDFKRIQLIRNELVDTLMAKKPLDYKQVSDQAGEVNKRAKRLKSFLMSPAVEENKGEEKKAEEKQAVEYDADAMKGALVKLCNTIFSFTGNPMFKDPGTVDTQKATKAGADLLSIIELSDNIKKNADRLSATSK